MLFLVSPFFPSFGICEFLVVYFYLPIHFFFFLVAMNVFNEPEFTDTKAYFKSIRNLKIVEKVKTNNFTSGHPSPPCIQKNIEKVYLAVTA